jgi:integrase
VKNEDTVTRTANASGLPSSKPAMGIEVVQERLGNSSITMTADRYGHLFPSADDSAELAAAEGRFG